MRRSTQVLLLASVSLTLTACGSSGSPSTATSASTTTTPPSTSASSATTTTTAATTTTVSVAALGRQYPAIIDPANVALTTFVQQDDALGVGNSGSAPPSEQAKLAAPLIAALQTAENMLLRVDWPANVATDVRSLTTEIGAVVGDLDLVSGLTALDFSSWEQTLSSDGGKLSAAANAVRADLGLPPPATTASAQVTWCRLTLGETKADVLAQMGAPHGNKAASAVQSLGGGFDYAEWDVGNDIFLATFTNSRATNLQAYAGVVGPTGASDISCQAFRNSNG
jgi:hypothetical protein